VYLKVSERMKVPCMKKTKNPIETPEVIKLSELKIHRFFIGWTKRFGHTMNLFSSPLNNEENPSLQNQP
jgi:hypothetical protein